MQETYNRLLNGQTMTVDLEHGHTADITFKPFIDGFVIKFEFDYRSLPIEELYTKKQLKSLVKSLYTPNAYKVDPSPRFN